MADAPFIFDRESARAVDRAAIEEYGVPGIVLMENASRALASCALDMLSALGTRHSAVGGEPPQKGPLSILIVCGSGNNGGDGYAAARHLHNAGCDVTLCAVGEPREGTDAAIHRAICQRMNLPLVALDHLIAAHGGPALLIDALFGTGLDRPVEGEAARIIAWMNDARANGSLVLAADIPSGLDCDTGRELGIAVRADRTVSFLGMKKGFLAAGAGEYTGEIVVGDIGAPVELLERFALKRTPDRRT